MTDTRRNDASIGTLVSQLVDDGKAYARAEISVWKAIAASRKNDAIMGAVFAGGAVVLALAAVGALLVGLIFILRPALGIGGATAAVVLVTLLIAGILGKMAASRFGRVASGDGL